MEYLDIAIAFSIVMLTLAQFSNIAISALNLGIKTRKKEFDKWRKSAEEHIEKILNTRNVDATAVDAFKRDFSVIASIERESRTPHLNNEIVSELAIYTLANNDNSGGDSTTVGVQINDGLQRIGTESTDRFRFNSMLKAMVIASVIAIIMNINSFELVSFLYKDPEVTQALIQDRLGSLESNLEKSTDPIEKSHSRIEIMQLEEQLSELKKWQDTGLPIGFNLTFEYTLTGLLGCIISGVLAGLGAPFWHVQLTRLLTIRQSLQSNKVAASPTPAVSMTENVGVTNALSDFQISSGATGSFAISNPQYDASTKSIDVDVRLIGQPEQVLKLEELKRVITAFYANKQNKEIRDINIRFLPSGNIENWLFHKNN